MTLTATPIKIKTGFATPIVLPPSTLTNASFASFALVWSHFV